jgi:3-hydroxyisobutyrate dehydrogenase-like beta-hydroxyacid dehydrogenase
MGGAIATQIIGGGHPTVVWARRPKVAKLYTNAARTAPTPAALASLVDLVSICVWDDDDVRSVMRGPDGVLAGCRPGTLVAIHSTVRPDTCRELAAEAWVDGVVVLDAPVSGGPDAALAGALAVAVGGPEEAFAACHHVFETFASTIVHVGDVGSGQLAKLLNNALLAANLALSDETLDLGTALGVDADQLGRFLHVGSGRSFGLDVALKARTSDQTRSAALPALEKDIADFHDATSMIYGANVLRAAALAGLARLRPPTP